MALVDVIKTDCASIAVWQIDEIKEEIKRFLGDDVLAKKIENVYKNEKRQREQLISHLLVKELLGEAKEISHLPNGAPHIEESDKFISISHSRKCIAVAISNNPIGIDIEEIERNQFQLHKKFTTPNEQRWIEEVNELQQKQLISAIIWSAKEAIYKLANIEGLLFESEIEISPFTPSTQAEFKATYRNTSCYCQLLEISGQLLVVSC